MYLPNPLLGLLGLFLLCLGSRSHFQPSSLELCTSGNNSNFAALSDHVAFMFLIKSIDTLIQNKALGKGLELEFQLKKQ